MGIYGVYQIKLVKALQKGSGISTNQMITSIICIEWNSPST